MQSGAGKSQSSSLPIKISIDDEDVIRVILTHLHAKGHISAMRALEKESGVEAERLGEDASFLRALVLDGLWEEAIALVEPLRPGTAVHNRACFEIRKQEFLEMLEAKERGDNAAALVKALQRLEPGSTREEFNDLCFCLTLPDLKGHTEYSTWTPQLGRLWCFEALRGYLGLLFPGQETPTEVIPEDQLELLCRQACMYQAEQRRRKHPNTVFPRTVTGGILSEVWTPKPARSGGGSGSISSEAGSRGASQTTNTRYRRTCVLRPKSSPALQGFHCGKLDDCDSGVLKRQASDQPFRWMLSCVGGDRSDMSPRSVGLPGGFETSDIQQFHDESPSPVLKGSPVILSAGDTKASSAGSRLWPNSAATTVLGASFQGNRGGAAAAAAATAAATAAAATAAAVTAAATTGSVSSKDTSREGPMPRLFTSHAPAAQNARTDFTRLEPALSPSKAAAPPQLEQLTPRWPMEWRNVNGEKNAHGGSLSNEGERDPFCPAPVANGMYTTAVRAGGGYMLLSRACSSASEREAGRGGKGIGEHRHDRSRESVTGSNVPANTNGARKEREGGEFEQHASGGTPAESSVWETSMTSTEGESPARSSQGILGGDETETGTYSGSEEGSRGTSEAESREDHGGGGDTMAEEASPPQITPQLQQWDPRTTLSARSEEFDEENAQPRQTPGQYDRISRPDHQSERADRPIDRRLTEGGENTSQHQPEPSTFPRPLLTVSASGGSEDEMKSETPEGNTSRRYDYSYANKLFVDPGATGVGGPGSADGGDKDGGSRVPSDISLEDFDEITKEEAPGFVPTVVFMASQLVRSVGFSSDGALFAAGSNDCALRVCRTPSESEMALAHGEIGGMRAFEAQTVLRSDDHHKASIYCLAFSPDSALIATGSNDKMVKLLRIPHRGTMTTDGISQYDETTNAEDHLVLRGHTGTIRDLCFPSPAPTNRSAGEESGGGAAHNRRLLTAGAGDFACRMWDVEGVPLSGGGKEAGLEPLVVFRGHTDTVFSCSLLPGGEIAVTGGSDSVVRVWDARTGGGVRSLIIKDQDVLCVRPWPRDPERLMMTSHSDGQCFLWDMRTGRALSSVSSHKNQTRAIDFSTNGHSLLTASLDGLIGVSECREEPWARSAEANEFVGENGDDNGGGRQVSVSTLAMLKAHRGRVLQARWRPTAPAAFITSSTDCAVLLWTISGVGMRVRSY